MAKKSLTSVTTKLHDLLKPLDSAERIRAIKAALMLLGDQAGELGGGEDEGQQEDKGKVATKRTGKAALWMKANSVTDDHLSHVFHDSEIIASEIPGKDSKRKTINVYVLTGLSKFLETGEATFDDKSARAACKSHGCYNSANHSSYMSSKGNVLSGSKAKGWTLTAPGLKAGADLVKEIAQG